MVEEELMTYYLKVKICITPYDEINCEAPEDIAETIATELYNCMVKAGAYISVLNVNWMQILVNLMMEPCQHIGFTEACILFKLHVSLYLIH